MNETSKRIEEFLSYLREAQQTHTIAEMDLKEANDARQDILHALELENQSYHESAKLAKTLKEVRQQRRAAKDKIIQTVLVVEWIAENPQTIKALERLLGDVRKAEKSLEHRVYVPRTDAGRRKT